MVPAERSFVLASDLKAPPLDGLELFTKAKDNVGKVGDGNDFLAIGGHVALDPDRGGVLADVLPPLIHVDGSSPEASTIRWLLDQLVKEVDRESSGRRVGLKAARAAVVRPDHPVLSCSLRTPSRRGGSARSTTSALHRRCATCTGSQVGLGNSASLPSRSGMSRTSFALRFKANAGVAPLTYLQNLRMRLAEHELREGAMSVSELAESLGYASDSAFSNAFKRRTGMAPKHYQSIVARMDGATSSHLR